MLLHFVSATRYMRDLSCSPFIKEAGTLALQGTACLLSSRLLTSSASTVAPAEHWDILHITTVSSICHRKVQFNVFYTVQ